MVSNGLRERPLLPLTLLTLAAMTSACVAMKNPPIQEYAWEVSRHCEHVNSGWTITRVDPSGQIHIRGTNTTSADDFESGTIAAAYQMLFPGESAPVPASENDALFAGTFVVGGEGRAEVEATGASTRLAAIAHI